MVTPRCRLPVRLETTLLASAEGVMAGTRKMPPPTTTLTVGTTAGGKMGEVRETAPWNSYRRFHECMRHGASTLGACYLFQAWGSTRRRGFAYLNRRVPAETKSVLKTAGSSLRRRARGILGKLGNDHDGILEVRGNLQQRWIHPPEELDELHYDTLQNTPTKKNMEKRSLAGLLRFLGGAGRTGP